MHPLRNIVVGTDHSACADDAIAAAIRIGASVNARVTVVHVCTLSADHAMDDARLRACHEVLVESVARFVDANVELVPVLRSGTAADKLNNVAAEVGARLIIVGRTGAGSAALLGRVSERLLRIAARPVLVVPCSAR